MDIDQLMVLRCIEEWLRRVAQACNLTADGGVGGLWGAILSARAVPASGRCRSLRPIRAPRATWRGSGSVRSATASPILHELDQLDVLMNVAAGEAMPTSRPDLEELHRAIALTVTILRQGRRSPVRMAAQ